MQILKNYFPELTVAQLDCYQQLPALYTKWNAKINVISRQDIDNIAERHILHSLAIAKKIIFPDQSTVLDLGTGGGFPGIPLAIYFPKVQFHLVDGTNKKITVVQDVIKSLKIDNAAGEHCRSEDLTNSYDFIVTRAVADISVLWKYSQRLLKDNGTLVCLKGGQVADEIKKLPTNISYEIVSVATFFSEEFFNEKSIVIVKS